MTVTTAPDRVSVFVGATDQLADIARQAAAHPAFGFLFDLGTVAALTRVVGDVPREITRLCEQADPAGTCFEMISLSPDALADHVALRGELERRAAASAVCVVLVPDKSELPPLVLVCGATVPSMGVQAECDPKRLLATFAYLAGTPSPDDDSLFTEPTVAASIMEEKLSDRLKQLYGE
jgi:hypothetical protein